jgi:hypothetical protein
MRDLLRELEEGLLEIAGEIASLNVELLAFVHGPAGLPDEGVELCWVHSETDPDE